ISVAASRRAWANAPARSSVLDSTATATSAGGAGGAVSTRPAPGSTRNGSGTPSALPTCAVRPILASASCSASAEPRQSPSGATWQAIKTLRLFRRAAAIWQGRSVIARTFRDFANQRHDARTPLNRLVESKADFRREAHLQALAQFAPHIPLGALQPSHGIRLGLGVPEHTDEHLRVAQVHAHLDIGDRGEANPRVLELVLDDLADLRPNECPDSFGSVGHMRPRVFALSRSRVAGRRDYATPR